MNAQNNLVTFFVEGEPRPKQSFRVSGRGRGFQPARVVAWQTEVAIMAEIAMRKIGRFAQPYDTGLLAVELVFRLGDHRKVDCDNLSKAVLDGLNGICYGDDNQIVDLRIIKMVVFKEDKTGVEVKIGYAENFLNYIDKLVEESVYLQKVETAGAL